MNSSVCSFWSFLRFEFYFYCLNQLIDSSLQQAKAKKKSLVQRIQVSLKTTSV